MHLNLEKIKHKVDLCVVGGGLAGISAAIMAARKGISVVLMHDRPTLGGNASSEVRMWVCGAQGEDNRESGIIEEIALENLYSNPTKSHFIFDAILYEKVKSEKNITLLLNCSCLDAETNGDSIVSVTGWQGTTQQYHIVEAKLFADCSGDSILAPLTSAEFRIGREADSEFGENISVKVPDKKTMGISCLLQARLEDTPSRFIAPDFALRLSEEDIARRPPNMRSPYENYWYLELGGEEDCIGDTESIRDRLLALAMGYWDYIKNSGTVENADYWRLEFLGFLPAKRESRRMIGDHILTQPEVMSGGIFDDAVAYGGWGLDDHDPAGFYHEGSPNVNLPTPSPYGIPYRCLYSVNIDNLFFAGRNISATHAAMSSSRVMATCSVMGQAVGAAAALCIGHSCKPRKISISYIDELQQILMDDDCFIPRFKRNISPLAIAAELKSDRSSAENIENLRNGIDRNHIIYSNADQGCTVELGDKIIYELEKEEYIASARLTFDSDLNRKTVPGDACERYHITRANIVPSSPSMHMPTTLVKSYELYTESADGKITLVAKEELNRMRTVSIPIRCNAQKLIFIPLEKWESDDHLAHIFSFDFK